LNRPFCLNRRLSLWEEAVGELREIREEGGCCLAVIGPISLVFPLDMFAQLKDLHGNRIGVLRTEDGYRYRVMKHEMNRIARIEA
jgi:hypothetical protein